MPDRTNKKASKAGAKKKAKAQAKPTAAGKNAAAKKPAKKPAAAAAKKPVVTAAEAEAAKKVAKKPAPVEAQKPPAARVPKAQAQEPQAPAVVRPPRPPAREPAPKPQVAGELESPAEEDEIKVKVISIVANHMTVDETEITRETSFVNDLNADSLDTVELVMDFEDAFELSIPDEEAEKIQTVGQAIDYIKEHTRKA